jgi:hypothetical protein
MIHLPRALIIAVAALFSAYHLFLGIYSVTPLALGTSGRPINALDGVGPRQSGVPDSVFAVALALLLYLLISVAVLWPARTGPMSRTLAGSTVLVSLVMTLLVGSVFDGDADLGYATWHVAAVGTLMTIVATRRQPVAALLGVMLLVGYTLWWASPHALVTMGVIGSVVWVVTAILLSQDLVAAGRATRQYAEAEREAAQWQAAQEAHLYERQSRLRQTVQIAAPMLRLIGERDGQLSSAEQAECRLLEAAVRDEIRGRRLLNDAVRTQVRAARERGAQVTLRDEGGVDDLLGDDLAQVLDRLAEALAGTTAETLIVRTVDGTSTAVTVVGLSRGDASVSALGQEHPGEEVDLWLEIPRQTARPDLT